MGSGSSLLYSGRGRCCAPRGCRGAWSSRMRRYGCQKVHGKMNRDNEQCRTCARRVCSWLTPTGNNCRSWLPKGVVFVREEEQVVRRVCFSLPHWFRAGEIRLSTQTCPRCSKTRVCSAAGFPQPCDGWVSDGAVSIQDEEQAEKSVQKSEDFR